MAYTNSTGGIKGGALIVVLIGITVLSLLVGGVTFKVTSYYQSLSYAASWQEALLAAESGGDFAMAELRKSLSTPETAWDGWDTADAAGNPYPNDGRAYRLPSLSGQAGGVLTITLVEVDAPPALIDTAGNQWYRIRSTGTAPLTDPWRVSLDKRDNVLRRLNLIWDRKTGSQVIFPQTSRLVEIIARPSSFENAILTSGLVKLNNHKIITDSYDSRSESKSTSGQYDASKRQQNADVATNGQIVDAGNSQIYGDVLTNSGIITGAANITGEQRPDFYQEILPVKDLTWTTFSMTPVSVTGATTLQGGSASAPGRYKLSTISLSGSNVLTLAPSAPGVPSYVEIWVTGDVKTSGNGTIKVGAGVTARIYIEGNMDITGNGFVNSNARAAHLGIFGLGSSSPGGGTMNINGNGAFIGTIYAPYHDLQIGGGGSTGTVSGAIVANTVTMNGNAEFHYDEALAAGPFITDYKIAGWFEDNK